MAYEESVYPVSASAPRAQMGMIDNEPLKIKELEQVVGEKTKRLFGDLF